MPTRQATKSDWTTADAEFLYGIRNWSSGAFDISADGEVRVNLRRADQKSSVSLRTLATGLKERGIGLPVLLRFSDLLDARIALINQSFEQAIQEAGYDGVYRGVYPIKVNQQQQVVEEITGFGRIYHHGLEAGSKAELTAALAYLDDPEAYIVCNGYKDQAFIDLALYATKMGIQTILVVEMPTEVESILDRADALGVRPRLGVRTKLSSQGSGHWTASGGDRSVFGLNAAQLIDVVDVLRRRDRLDCLEMLHYHVGSQVTAIRTIRSAAAEAMRIYANLIEEGAAMGLLDVGGGLAIDYDGSHSLSPSSANYSVAEYCADIVDAVMSVADEEDVPHPTLLSESGRAIVAPYSVLLFNILDVCRFEPRAAPDELPEDAHELIVNLKETSDMLSPANLQECYHDAIYYRDELRSRFAHGTISLRERALAEQMFWHIISRIAAEAKCLPHTPDELQDLESAMADIYYGNFSLFQSLPDAWAIDQLFPIMPIQRLGERPGRQGILADCTCDCDGKLDRFINHAGVRPSLSLHEIEPDEEYMIGIFLVGAYQETLGDLHNLFGDTNVVSVALDEEGQVGISRELFGDSVADVLSYVEYQPRDLTDRFRRRAESAVRQGRITPQQRRDIVQAYEDGLRGSTYFDA